jgi:hypothetical protein
MVTKISIIIIFTVDTSIRMKPVLAKEPVVVRSDNKDIVRFLKFFLSVT